MIKPKIYRSIRLISDYFLLLNYKLKFAKRYQIETKEVKEIDHDSKDFYEYSDRYKLYDFILGKYNLVNIDLDYLEFGVFEGDSIKWWLEYNKNSKSKFYGFDTFTGLPEKWDGMPAGTFSTKGNVPEVKDKRCSFITGLFQDTFHEFLASHTFNRQTIIHMDADIYSATLFVLTSFGPYFKKGDILIFDEFRSEMHEFKAFIEFKLAYNIEFKLIGVVNKGQQIAFMVE